MRKITRAFTGLAAAALAVGMAGPALAANQARPLERVPAHAAFQPGSGQSIIVWNRELITLLGTPGLQPATIHRPAASPFCKRPSTTRWSPSPT